MQQLTTPGDAPIPSHEPAASSTPVGHWWIHSLPVAIALLDPAFNYIAVNQRWLDFLQTLGNTVPHANSSSGDDLIGQPFLPPFVEYAETWHLRLQDCLAGNPHPAAEFSLVQADGTLNWWRWEASLVTNGPTHPQSSACLAIALTPITPYKRREAELQQSIRQLQHQYSQRTAELRRTISSLEEEISDRLTLENQLRFTEKTLRTNEKQYQQILNAITDMVLVKGPESRIIWANQAFCTYYGMTPDELENLLDAPFSKPDYTQQYVKDDAFVFATGRTLEIEEPVVRHDGEVRLFSTIKSAIRNELGQVIMTVGVSRDITIQKQIEQQRLLTEIELRNSQQRLHLLAQQMPIALIEWDETFTISEWNPEAERIFGYTREEAIGQAITFVIPEDIQPQIIGTVQNLIYNRSSLHSINTNLTKAGKTIICQWHNTPLIDQDGEMIGMASMAIDITERQQAELQLRQQEQFLRCVYEGVEDCLFVLEVGADGDVRYAGWNSKTAQNTGIASESIVGKTPVELFGPAVGGDIAWHYRQCLETKATFRYEEHREFEGANGWWLTTLNPVFNEAGDVTQILGTASNISDRKRAEAKLREQEQFLRSIYDGVSTNIFVLDVLETGEIVYVDYNQAAERTTGQTRYEIKGKTPFELFSADEAAIMTELYQTCIATKEGITQEEHLTFKTGDRWSLTTFNPLQNAEGRVYRIVGTAVDITNLKRIEATLQETLRNSEYQSQLLRTVLDSTPDWIFAKDRECRYILANESYAKAIGKPITTLLGRTDLDLGFSYEQVCGDATAGLQGFRHDDRRALAGEMVHNPNDPATIADGSVRIFDSRKVPLYEADGSIFAMLGICRDITERHHAEAEIRRSEAIAQEKAEQLQQALIELQQTQAQLVQNEKMSGLGQLVAGVAHEINNPVNFIYGNLNHAQEYTQDLLGLVELYQHHYPDPPAAIATEVEAIDLEFLVDDLPKLIGSMKVGAERIQKIVASLRTFSRMDEAEMKAVNIHEGIDSTLMILQHRLKAKESHPEITIHRDYGDLPLVECYAGQLNQVFMNILSNAIDALEETWSHSRDKSRDHPPAIAIHTQRLATDLVEIRLTDNGPGIPPAIQQRLFDPFFTTKPIGKGTGMGLSISYQIVTEKHRGSLHCESAIGQGTAFIIRIPLRQA